MDASAWIALFALIVSIYTVISSEIRNRRNKKENKILEERQNELTRLLLEKETENFIENKKADLGARVLKIGKGTRVKVFNKGKSTAYNVMLKIDDNEHNPLLTSDLKDKFPYEMLHPHEDIELLASTYLGMQSKYKIELSWSDDSSKYNVKDVYINF
ncbi:hypothetical protein AB6F65_11695 [Providencia hangzhouensis]|uniref:hypothetical protein n=1 Tax=Providencia hangzhouensis TaxID=3031799 RepID=UPI0034DCDE65